MGDRKGAHRALVEKPQRKRPLAEVNQSHYRPEVPRGFQEVKVPRLHDNGPVVGRIMLKLIFNKYCAGYERD